MQQEREGEAGGEHGEAADQRRTVVPANPDGCEPDHARRERQDHRSAPPGPKKEVTRPARIRPTPAPTVSVAVESRSLRRRWCTGRDHGRRRGRPAPKASAASPAASRARLTRCINTAVTALILACNRTTGRVRAGHSPHWRQPRCAGRRRLLASHSSVNERSLIMRSMNGRARLGDDRPRRDRRRSWPGAAAVAKRPAVTRPAAQRRAGGAADGQCLRRPEGSPARSSTSCPRSRSVLAAISASRSTQHAMATIADDAEQQVVRAVAAGQGRPGLGRSAGLRHHGRHQLPGAAGADADRQLPARAGRHRKRAFPTRCCKAWTRSACAVLGVLADGLRKPIAVKHPLLGAADWRGHHIRHLKSQGQAQAIQALGANPMEVFRRSRNEALSDGELQGFEMNLLIYDSDGLAQACPVRDGERQPVAADGCPARQSGAPRCAVRAAARLARASGPGRRGTFRRPRRPRRREPPRTPARSGARFANASKAGSGSAAQCFRPCLHQPRAGRPDQGIHPADSGVEAVHTSRRAAGHPGRLQR